jgi:hypothetical protein
MRLEIKKYSPDRLEDCVAMLAQANETRVLTTDPLLLIRLARAGVGLGPAKAKGPSAGKERRWDGNDRPGGLSVAPPPS